MLTIRLSLYRIEFIEGKNEIQDVHRTHQERADLMPSASKYILIAYILVLLMINIKNNNNNNATNTYQRPIQNSRIGTLSLLFKAELDLIHLKGRGAS